MPMPKRATLVTSLIPLILAAVISAAWAIDHARLKNRVARNVVVAGVPIGTLDPEDAKTSLDQLATDFPKTPVVISADGLELNTTIGDLGYSVDVDQTIDVMAQAVASNLAPALEGAARGLRIEGKQSDGKALINMFCSRDGETPQS